MGKILMKGNEAIAEAAIRAGCEAYFGYPITPQTEILEYLARRLVELDRVFIQAESEVSAINMVYGAACAGARVMTTTSSPGFSLMQEGISYIACSEVPAVVVNIMRGGPGMGNIQPTQADYFQITKGGGHGDYNVIVLAPATLQEAVELTILAFDLADKYRCISSIVADGMIGQIMEPVELPEVEVKRPDLSWALTGAKGRKRILITSLHLEDVELEKVNLRLQETYARIRASEQRHVEYMLEGAEVVVVTYGTAGRIAQTAVRQARSEGLPVGLFRPVTLWPFPSDALGQLVEDGQVRRLLVFELSAGQMLEDVRLATHDRLPIDFYGKMGGVVPTAEEVLAQVKRTAQLMPEGVR